MSYHSDFGPEDGPILYNTAPVMGVFDSERNRIGIAWLAGSIEGRRGPVQVWRLEVNKVELEGRWICDRREFVRPEDAED